MRFLMTLICCLLLSACFARSSHMSRDNFDDVTVGMTTQQVRELAGDPMEIVTKANQIEYIYVEKITMGSQVAMENHYTIVIQDDKVVAKTLVTKTPPAYDMLYQNDPNFTQNY